MEKLAQIVNEIRKNKGLSSDIALEKSMRLREDLGFDSFDLAELTVHVEENFGVDVFESGVVDTIGEVCEKLKI